MLALRIEVVAAVLAAALPSLEYEVNASEPAGTEDTRSLPNGLSLGLRHRFRYARVTDQFRVGREGNDQALSLRTQLDVSARWRPLLVRVELMDSRVYAFDDNTPINTGVVNTLDVLQAYGRLRLQGLIFADDELHIRVGRLTMDVGSRRLVARNRYRNTINAFTGLDVSYARGPSGPNARAFAVLPVQRQPVGSEAIRSNDWELDRASFDVVLWGAIATSRFANDLDGEAYLFGLHERDGPERPTADRKLFTPGLRVSKSKGLGAFDFDFEGAAQFGRSRSSSADNDGPELDHLAYFVHAAAGYTFASPYRPRLAVEYDFVSGDGRPDDQQNGRFDRLFGAQRFEYGPTGIYGAFGRRNVNAPGVRFELIAPEAGLSSFIAYRPFWSASADDPSTTGLTSDEPFLGHQLEGRLRWAVRERNLQVEMGFARVFRRGLEPLVFYLQTTISLGEP